MKTVEGKYKKLNEVEHCLKRPGRYIGSITPHTSIEWLLNEQKKMEQREVTYNPGFLKIFDEIITNSADHSKTAEGKHLDVIRIEVDQSTGEISCYDNGGIPVVKHAEYNQWIPELIFELRAGSNFDDEDQSMAAGQNGEGSALTCIFSEKFTVETCDTKHRFKMTFSDNSQTRPEPKITEVQDHKGYTKITYIPEFARLGMTGIDDANFEMLRARTVEIAATNTHLKVYFNQERILTRTFKEYIELFSTDEQLIYDDGGSFKVGVIKSEESGFQHTSYVNGTKTKIGGTHITYVVNQIVDELRVLIKKKHKVEVKPADIRNHLHLFIDCNIINPRYTSQTKDELITEPSSYGKTWTVPDRFIRKLMESEIIQSVLDWVKAKQDAELQKELRKVGKEQGKADPRKVDKFSDATERTQRHKCVLVLAEGDSAAKSVQGGRGSNPYIASFPLKGKPLNVREKEIARVLGLDRKKEGKKTEPNEIQKILTIIGLQIGEKVKTIPVPDGEWVELEINGEKIIANENDLIIIQGQQVKVSTVL